MSIRFPFSPSSPKTPTIEQFFNKGKFVGADAIVPDAKPMTKIIPFHAIHLRD